MSELLNAKSYIGHLLAEGFQTRPCLKGFCGMDGEERKAEIVVKTWGGCALGLLGDREEKPIHFDFLLMKKSESFRNVFQSQ